MAKKLTKQDVIELCESFHGKRYDYSDINYVNRRTNIRIFCPEHDTYFEVNPRHHWKDGVKCSQCFEQDKLEQHLSKANQTHNNVYDYSLIPLGVRAKDKVKIQCKLHGIFEQNFGNHLYGQGCPTCGQLFWGWSLDKFNLKCSEHSKGIGIFYILKCFNDEEIFYKIGITSKSIKSRYCTKQLMPYSYEIISEIKDQSFTIWNLENYLKNYIINNNIQYKPKQYFPGSLTECFFVGG